MHRKEYVFISKTVIAATVIMIICGLLTSHSADFYTVFKENREAVCIIIDAGHGGIDGGAVSCTGVYESQINLDIALRLNDLFQLLGYQTSMIRTEDISVYTEGSSIAEKKISDLKQRVRIVKNTSNPLVVSIHQNYYSDERYSGAQVFYAKNGKELAKLTQSLLVSTLNPDSNRKSKEAKGVYLMERIECPGILVECGFLSNPAEEYNLRSAAYQKKLCCVIVCALDQYINNSAVA